MNRCPIAYTLCGDQRYSPEGLRMLSPRLVQLGDFPYSRQEQVREAIARAAKISIQGVQPKLSVKLNTARSVFQIVDTGGNFIIKPQQDYYPELPENEDLTMRLAAVARINVPLHGMIYSKDDSLSYFIKRFDRLPKGKKIQIEDFAQLSGNTRETKYRSSMEKVAGLVEQFCTFPLIEKVKLFRLTMFSFLCGNEDMHLKNFSLIKREGKIELSPSYDLVNSTIALPHATEELALPVDGKKSGLTRNNLVDYFGRKRLNLAESLLQDELNRFKNCRPVWEQLIDISFLSDTMKEKYRLIVNERFHRVFNGPQ
jgi:serine/threonine-protein kinase HipA